MFVEEPREEILKIDMEPMNIQITSEPYIICNNFGYVPVIDVWVKNVNEHLLFTSQPAV